MSNIEISQGQRLDQRVIEIEPTLSRSFAVKLIDEGKVKVNDVVVTKAGYKLRIFDEVTVDYAAAKQPPIADIELPILYEDDDCMVINKPLGLLTHSKGAFNPEPTVETFLRQHVSGLNGERAGIVHRLDRATSGVMICAKTPVALAWLQKQFSQRKVKKSYMAIVTGHLANDHAFIDMPIERNPKKPQTFRVGANGKSALTEYHVVDTTDKLSLLKLTPETGRTHQLRVHLNHLGHPILGDTFYNGRPAERLFLHALSLEITLLSRERKVFEAPLPKIFKDTMKQNG